MTLDPGRDRPGRAQPGRNPMPINRINPLSPGDPGYSPAHTIPSVTTPPTRKEPPMSDHRALRTHTLRHLNEVAVANNYNRALPDALLDRADLNGWHVLTPYLLHEHAAGQSVEPHMRCQVLVAVEGDDLPAPGWIDVPLDELDKLATVDDVKAGRA